MIWYPSGGKDTFGEVVQGADKTRWFLSRREDAAGNATLFGTNQFHRAASTNTAERALLIRELGVCNHVYLYQDTNSTSTVPSSYAQWRPSTSNGAHFSLTNTWYTYDAQSRLTNRWSLGKGNTRYQYDAVGNLTAVDYPTSTDVSLEYDALNRVTNMVDAVGTTRYGFVDDVLASEDGPWAADTVSFTYQNARLRSGLTIAAPNASAWAQTYACDDENQLVSVTVTNSTQTRYAYDGRMRLRVRAECVWRNGAWVTNAVVRYVYDGMLMVQERDGNNLPLATYTRGLDLSGSFEGAGGIGGLLARTDNALLIVQGMPTTHGYYHADGNGNVTALTDANQQVAARYVYDPYRTSINDIENPVRWDLGLGPRTHKEGYPIWPFVF